MANRMSILKASFAGKLGAVYGDDSKGIAKVKAIPFSRRPAKPIVISQCRAFECLNRFSAGVAKDFWQYLNLNDRKMLRHNAVASWLKGAIQNAQWRFDLLGETIGVDGSTQISNCVVNRTTGEFTINAIVTSGEIPDGISNAFWVALMDDQGKVIYSNVPLAQGIGFTGLAKLSELRRYFCVAFQSHKNPLNGKWQTNGFAYAECEYTDDADEYWQNGILLANRLKLDQAPYFENDNVCFPSNAQFVGDIVEITIP